MTKYDTKSEKPLFIPLQKKKIKKRTLRIGCCICIPLSMERATEDFVFWFFDRVCVD